jgi:hypothetical protein
MSDEAIGAPGGPQSDEVGAGGRAPEEAEGRRQGSPH